MHAGQLAHCLGAPPPEVTSCIIGATRPEQIEENAEASGIQLDTETVARIG